MHEGLVGERADAQRGGQLGAVGQRHLLRGVVGVEAVVRPAALAGPALAADRAPVQDDEVAGLDVGDALADRLDDARGLVAEQERVLVVDAALAVGQVGVTHTAGDDVDHHFTGTGVGDDDVDHLDGLAFLDREITPRTV